MNTRKIILKNIYTYIFITDYQNMRWATKENAGQLGVIYRDPKKPERSIIRSFDGSDFPKGARQAYLTRDDKRLYIDGVQFYIEELERDEQQVMPTEKGKLSDRDFYHTMPLLHPTHAGIVVVALRQPNRAAINSRLKWFMENIEEPLANRVFVLRDFSYRLR